jgi:cytochrome P450
VALPAVLSWATARRVPLMTAERTLVRYAQRRPFLHAGLRHAMASEEAIAQAAHALLDEALARERFDAATDYAFPLAGIVLADFLGVDRRDSERLVAWALDFIAFFNDVEITTQGTARMARAAGEMIAYAHALIRADRRSGFLELMARSAARHERELDDDTVGNFTLPFLTGEIGVTHLIANTMWLLLEHDDQRARVAGDTSLLAGAIAETLRYAPPVLLIPRIALQPVDLGGHAVRPGEVVRLSVGAANRDPIRFPEPDRFDVRRPNANRHVAFAHGPHVCIGMHLARLEAHTAVGRLLERLSRLRLAPGHQPAPRGLVFRKPPELRVVWTLSAGARRRRTGRPRRSRSR